MTEASDTWHNGSPPVLSPVCSSASLFGLCCRSPRHMPFHLPSDVEVKYAHVEETEYIEESSVFFSKFLLWCDTWLSVRCKTGGIKTL